jgi:hypothetical protein
MSSPSVKELERKDSSPVETVPKGGRRAEPREVSEDEIERRLAEEGLIRVPTRSQPAGEFKRIDVGGKPASEMIIEERR